MTDYEFSVTSHDKKHEGETFRAFQLNNESVIGVEEKEPFALRFRNNTNSRVQVRLSVDGTDVLTGEPASTKPAGQMFLVGPNESLSLAAWPETLQGGARFVFTTKEDGVAVNTHGITVGVGLIAAAVYVDYSDYQYNQVWGANLGRFGGGVIRSAGLRGGRAYGSGGSYNSNQAIPMSYNTKGLIGPARGADQNDIAFASLSSDDDADNLSVGAGEQIAQTLSKTAGLSRPVLDEILQMRYLPWAKLQTMLGQAQPVHSSSAFPGDQKQVDLSKVPRTKSTARKVSQEVQRFL